MTEIDFFKIIDLMKGLWPKWDADDKEIGLWKGHLWRFDYEATKNAMKAAAFESDNNSPPRKTINRHLMRLQAQRKSGQPQRESASCPEPTIFLQYHGEGNNECRLLPGYFFPIYTRPGVDERRAAAVRKEQMAVLFGGEWRVYENAKHAEMIKMRNELRGY